MNKKPIRKIAMDDNTRAKIQVGNLLNRLQKYIAGEVDLTGGQVKAIEVLLRKSLPDLSSIDMSGSLDTRTTVKVKDLSGQGVSPDTSGSLLESPTGGIQEKGDTKH